MAEVIKYCVRCGQRIFKLVLLPDYWCITCDSKRTEEKIQATFDRIGSLKD